MATGNTAELDFSDLTGGHEEVDDDDTEIANHSEDICRVCRAGNMPGRPLFHPCLCTGSIRYIHQDCLVSWLKHSRKEFCELCMHQFEFVPIYRPDMPQHLPVTELVRGLLRGAVKSIRHWLHLGFVAFVWLVVVPICIYRIYSFLLYGSMWSIASFPLQLFSMENLLLDGVYGLLIVFVSLLGFISMVWLKDQLGNGGGPNWLARDQQEVNQLRIQEAQEQVNVIRNRLQEVGERARQRENAPERVAAATEILQLQNSLAAQNDQLKALEREKYETRLNNLEERKTSLIERLGFPSHSSSPENTGHNDRELLATPTSATPTRTGNSRIRGNHNFPSGSHDRLPGSHERERPIEWETRLELIAVNQELEALKRERDEYVSNIERILTHPASEHPERYGEDDENLEPHPLVNAHNISQEDKTVILRIWVLKDEIRDATVREQNVIERQENEERDERRVVQERRNRWFNRLLNRLQDDPLVNPPRRRNAQRQPRPNIGAALAGLAREQPVDGANGPQLDNVEELTWARLLGLDGSFRFLEHVLWLICLNSAIIIALIYFPYQIGYFTARTFQLWEVFGIETWKGVVSTLFGYLIVTVFITAIYYFTGMLKFPRLKSVLGAIYIGIKVGMILAVEAGVFPLMCGWWIDICSFGLFGSTMKSRRTSVMIAPGTVMFIHWLAGMIFIFYLASFVILMREVVRPGVLWFLRNLNDQEFHPIHEMIGLPLQRHLRRFVMSCVMFGVCVIIVLLLPSRLVLSFWKGFLPYCLTLTSNFSPIREVQLELILLQFVIPSLLEHGNCRAGLKFVVKHWAQVSARLFGLHSYLLDKPQTGGVVVDLHGDKLHEIPHDAEQEGPVYTGPLQVLGPGFAPFKPYLRPQYFYLRVAGFLTFTLTFTVVFSCFLLVLPVAVGRFLMSLVGVAQAPEVYTAAIGLYILWLTIRFGASIVSYVSQGVEILVEQIKLWSSQGVKCLVACVLLFVVIPLLLGHLVDLLLISPLRVPPDRTPIFYPSTEWALGLLHTKCTCGAIWLTNGSFKRKLDQVYQAGLRNLNLTFVVKEIAWPVIVPLSLFISVPYIVFKGLLPSFDLISYSSSLWAYRYFFPSILICVVCGAVIGYLIKQLRRLYIHIKNEKYLVGRQLVNYMSQTSQDVEELPDTAEDVEELPDTPEADDT